MKTKEKKKHSSASEKANIEVFNTAAPDVPKKPVRVGDKLPVTLKLEFDGTFRAYSILVENQFVPTENDQAIDHPVKFDGDPVLIKASFVGVSGSKVKKLEITINGVVGYSLPETTMKYEEMEIKIPVNYEKFNLVATT